MTLVAGTRLGPYEIVSTLGAGGMGEVYRARDTRLGRDVAVKVLPEEFARDPDRVARFEREARSASALSHANVVSVYDFGRERGSAYIVSEIVEGGDLRNLLERGPVPIRRALELAAQIASGLAAAHEIGIVHRDLKPENVLLTRNGDAKIADFGLAKLTDRAEASGEGGSQLPTSDGRRTSAGIVMGTVGYMSPEQAGGRPVDFRSDQFAFGTMLYEMLSGRTPFHRATPAETMTAILREEPEPLAEIAPNVPVPLLWAADRCLAKEPADRYASTRDLAHDLSRLRSITPGAMRADSAAATAPKRSRRRLLPAAAFTAGALLAALGAYLALRPPPAPPFYQQLTFRRGDVIRASFAPDGQTVLYSAAWQGSGWKTYLTRTNDRDSLPLALPDSVILSISSSGKVAIALDGNEHTLAETSLAAGAPRLLAEKVSFADYRPGTDTLAIARDGKIEFPPGKSLYDPGPGAQARNLRFSPDGRLIAFLEDRAGSTAVATVDLAGRKTVLSGPWSDLYGLAWHPVRREIWFTAREGPKAGVLALHAVSLSGRERLVASAPGILILKDIARDGRVLMARQDWRYSALFRTAGTPASRDLSWFNFSIPRALSPDGKTLLIDEDDVVYVRPTDGIAPAVRLGDGIAQDLSPDGKWAIALPVTSPDHLLLLPTGPGEAKSLDAGGIACRYAMWLPDGRRIIFQGNRKGEGNRIFTMPVSGGAARPLTPEGTGFASPPSPDGRFLPVWQPGHVMAILPIDGSSEKPRTITGIPEDENPQGWDSTGRFIYLIKGTKILRLEIATGRREPWNDIDLTDSAELGQIESDSVHVTPDGRFCAYARLHSSSDLYLVTGLR